MGTSLNLYEELYARRATTAMPIEREEVYRLFAQMEKELFVAGHSPLLSGSIGSVMRHAKKKRLAPPCVSTEYFSFRDEDTDADVAIVDAWILLNNLLDYIRKCSIASEIDDNLPYMFNSEYVPGSPDMDALSERIEELDAFVGKTRCLWMETSGRVAAEESIRQAMEIKERARKDAEACARDAGKIVENMYKKAREDADAITKEAQAAAKAEAEKIKSEIVKEANDEAKAIVAKAEEQAEAKLSEARKRALKITGEICEDMHKAEMQLYTSSFEEMNRAIKQAAERLKCAEDALCRTNDKKACRQLLQLHDFVGDICAAYALPEVVGKKLVAVMDMIADSLAEYGAEALVSVPDEDYNADFHTVVNKAVFAPADAKIKRSVRSGFIMGDEILRKEKVEI